MRRCQTLLSLCLWAEQQILPFPGCTLCNWTQQPSDAQTSRGWRAVIRRCLRPDPRELKSRALSALWSTDAPENGSRHLHRSKSNGCDQIQKTPFVRRPFHALKLIFRRRQRRRCVIWSSQTSRSCWEACWSVMWSHSSVTRVGLVWVWVFSLPSPASLHLPFPPCLLARADKRRHYSNMLLLLLTSCRIKSFQLRLLWF